MVTEVWEHCNTIEECYEFMLAYAAQGLPSDEGSRQVDKYANTCGAPSKQSLGWQRAVQRR